MATAQQPSTTRPMPVRLTLLAVLALALIFLSGYWVRQAEILSTACSLSGAAPAIPALAALILILLVNPLLRRVSPAAALSTVEALLLYVMLTIGVMMYGIGGVRHLLAALTEAQYLSTPAEPTETLTQFIPAWMAPKDRLAQQAFWEGAASGLVPWRAWWAPMAAWTGFFLLLGGAFLGLLLPIAGRWMDEERLTFPLARLPLEVLGAGAVGSFFRSPMTWLGIGAATLLNAVNMVRGVFFGGSDYGGEVYFITRIPLSYPWLVLGHEPPLLFAIQPGLIGLGYLVTNEVAASVVFFFIFSKLLGVGVASAGFRDGSIPYAKQQAFGGYMVIGAVALWRAVQALRTRASGGSGAPPRWALPGAAMCFAGAVTMLIVAGMTPWLAVSSLGVLVLSSLAYARVRADTGAPLLWARPYTTEYLVFWDIFGGRPLVPPGRTLASPTIFALTSFLSRTGFPSVSGYQVEGIRLFRQMGLGWRVIAATVMLAIGVGVLSGFYAHLVPFYAKGAVVLPGGHWSLGAMRGEYARVLRSVSAPADPDWPRLIATTFGGLVTILVALARTRWSGLPLHPVGYLLANCQYGCWFFPTFIIVGLVKGLVLRYGGNRTYARLVPAFLGFALGHFLSGGLVWGLLSASLGGPFLRWQVWVN